MYQLSSEDCDKVGQCKIKGVIFDFSQTLVNSANGFRSAEKKVERKIYVDLGLDSWSDFLEVYRKVRENFHSNFTFSRKAIWEEVYRHYSQEPKESLLKCWEREYWQEVSSKTIIFPETYNVLEGLNYKYQLGLITNTQGSSRSGEHRISQLPHLKSFFGEITVAGEQGLPPKPDSAPFRICLEGLNLEPSQAVFVGDDYKIDIQGASEAGLHSIWIKHHSLSRNWPEVEVKTSVPVINSLKGLLDMERILQLN